jgi:hemolysin activation/secretion protein
MKTFTSMLAVGLLTSTVLFAQAPQSAPSTVSPATTAQKEHLTPEQKAESVTSKMTSVCSLSAEQQTQVKQIVLERAQKNDVNREQLKGNKEAIKTANKENNKAAHDKLKTVLTADQMQKWHQYVKSVKQAKTGTTGTMPASATPASGDAASEELFEVQ